MKRPKINVTEDEYMYDYIVQINYYCDFLESELNKTAFERLGEAKKGLYFFITGIIAGVLLGMLLFL